MENLKAIDFNLIKHLEALLRIKNISRAAKDMGITQPAMSNSFLRLKKQFNDELLVRTKQGYRLTPLAETLQPKVEILLENFQSTFVERKNFDPKKDNYSFNIIVSDSAGFVLAPVLMAHISSHYPNIEINLLPMQEDHSLTQLENDDVSLAITSTISQDFPEKLYTKVLREDPFAVAACNELYKDYSSISFEEYLQASHYAVTPKGIDPFFVDKELKKLGKKRNVVSRISHFSIAIRSILKTCYIVTLPSSVLEESQKYIPFKIFQVPVELPMLKHSLLWHERVHKDQAHSWLRQLISEVVKEMPGVH